MTKTNGYCAACGAALHGRYCSECGRPRPDDESGETRVPWRYVAGAVAVLAFVTAFVVRRGAPARSPSPTPPATQAVSSGPAAAPDISALSPRERFDQLFDRVMRASENGDATTVGQFAPMALAAFDLLPSPDVDARFHAALIRIAAGDLDVASSLAAGIAREQPAHLFASIVKGRVAEQRQDHATLRTAQTEFLAAYPAEMALGRPEYAGHQTIVERFLNDARAPKAMK